MIWEEKKNSLIIYNYWRECADDLTAHSFLPPTCIWQPRVCNDNREDALLQRLTVRAQHAESIETALSHCFIKTMVKMPLDTPVRQVCCM